MHKLAVIIFCLITTRGIAGAFCFQEAGETYNIAPEILWCISKGEANFKPNAINYNKNGTIDIGLMQINSSWKSSFKPEVWNNIWDPCTNVKAGAWILANCIKKYGYTWEAVGCYHSQTPDKKAKYSKLIYEIFKKNEHYFFEEREKLKQTSHSEEPEQSDIMICQQQEKTEGGDSDGSRGTGN